MSATTIGGLIGGAIDSMSGGDDSNVDGMIKGAIAANILKAVLPLAVTYGVGWAVLRAGEALYHRVSGAGDAA